MVKKKWKKMFVKDFFVSKNIRNFGIVANCLLVI